MNPSEIEVQIELIRNASLAIESIYIQCAAKSINELQAFLRIYKQNEIIQDALKRLKELNL